MLNSLTGCRSLHSIGLTMLCVRGSPQDMEATLAELITTGEKVETDVLSQLSAQLPPEVMDAIPTELKTAFPGLQTGQDSDPFADDWEAAAAPYTYTSEPSSTGPDPAPPGFPPPFPAATCFCHFPPLRLDGLCLPVPLACHLYCYHFRAAPPWLWDPGPCSLPWLPVAPPPSSTPPATRPAWLTPSLLPAFSVLLPIPQR